MMPTGAAFAGGGVPFDEFAVVGVVVVVVVRAGEV
jgi:hypothetical protein